MKEVTLVGILCVHIYTSIRVQMWIRHSSKFTPRQKRIHTFLVWILPFIWNTVLKTSIQPQLPNANKKNPDKLKEY